MARTVILIAADPSYLYALCNDGEVFRLVNHVWQPVAPIHQDDPRDPGARPKPGFIPIADEPGGRESTSPPRASIFVACSRRIRTDPSVPMMVRHRSPESLALRA
jgi:hypothetical protein